MPCAIPISGYLFLLLNLSAMKTLQEKIDARIAEIRSVDHLLPGAVIIHRIYEGYTEVQYMSQRGLDYLKLELDVIKKAGKHYFKTFLTEKEHEYIPQMLDLITRNDENEVFTFFQQVRSGATGELIWHLSSLKIMMKDDEGKPVLLLVLSHPVQAENHLLIKIERLTQENDFLKANMQKFSALTDRERLILQHIAKGKTNKEIANETSISVSTVETHRKKIKAKLDAKTGFELTQYAIAFNLI